MVQPQRGPTRVDTPNSRRGPGGGCRASRVVCWRSDHGWILTPPVDLEARRHALETALVHTENALARLTQAVAEGGAVATLVQAIRDQERRHQAIGAQLVDLKRPRVVPMTAPQLRAVLCEKANEWRALLRKHAPIARQMIRKLVEGRIVFTPDRQARRYTFRATGTLATFFSGIVCPHVVTSPTGFEPVFWP
jgi:hypothetical protein